MSLSSSRLFLMLAVTLAALGLPRSAAAGPIHPSPDAVALSVSSFPSNAAVQAGPAGDLEAARATGLHITRLSDLGRTDGYLEVARWPMGPARRDVSLTYAASLFDTVSHAQAAYGEAENTLWQSGVPVDVRGLGLPTYRVHEENNSVDLVAVFQWQTIESELLLHYPGGLGPNNVSSATSYLVRVGRLAQDLAYRTIQQLHPTYSPVNALPPIYVAPWGTGPIIKSPSLMVMDTTLVPPATVLNPGSFSQAAAAPLQTASTDHPALLPTRSLAAYSTTASGGGGTWFDGAALYSSPAAAGSAFEQLVGQNRVLHWLQPYGLGSYGGFAAALKSADAVHTWRGNGEMVLAVRRQNVILVLGSHQHRPIDLALAAGRVVETAPGWLHTSGTQIVDASGAPVRLVALNWYGAEQQDFVVGGLDYRPYGAILETIKRDGYNAIRLPFSDQLVEQNPVVTSHVGANPELSGLHALDILDRIVNYAGALGISVILDNHRSDAGWSAEENGLWYTSAYPDSAFQQDWSTMAQRYAVNDAVVAADLRNEPHGPATWGDGNAATDWQAAAQRAGDTVLKTNPHLLIMVEGIEVYGGGGGWWGGNLMGVARVPVSLAYADGSSAHQQLVYSPHDYGPDNCAGGCPWFNPSTTYDSLVQVWEQRWGFITDDPTQPYAAPVWLGEFGTCNYRATCVADTTPGSQGQWFSSLIRYIGEKGLGWAYWSANGTQSTGGNRVYGALDWYGYFNTGWTTPYAFLDRALQGIQTEQDLTDPQTPLLANGQPRPQPAP